MINELVVNPTEFGIEENKAGELMGNLPQIKTEREALTTAYDAVLKLDLNDPQTAKQAREIRLKIRDNRTKGIEVWHKNTKEVFLRFGQFVDAVKRQEIEVNQRMESNLEQIEKHAEIQENKRLDELEKARLEKLEPFKEFVPFGVNVRTISDEDFEKIFNGSKLQFDAKIEAERLAEEQRKEEERLSELARIEREKEIEAQRIENERLKKEAEEKERQLEEERKKAKEEADRIEAQRQAELKAEREKQAQLEAELKAKQEAERKAEEERLAEIERQKKEAEKLAKAPVKKQMTAWIDLFTAPEKTVDNELSNDILAKFESFKKWAKSEIEKL
jgi:colicin import membrane protein